MVKFRVGNSAAKTWRRILLQADSRKDWDDTNALSKPFIVKNIPKY